MLVRHLPYIYLVLCLNKYSFVKHATSKFLVYVLGFMTLWQAEEANNHPVMIQTVVISQPYEH